MKRHTVVVLLCLWLAGCAGQFFHPMARHVNLPSDRGLAYEDVWLTAADGTRLHGWFLPARGEAHGTVLFLHGNAENISTHIASVDWLPARGYHVLLIDYRGFGASHGTPSVEGALQDIDAALRWLLARRDIDRRRIVVFGQSLGASLAIYYVAHSEHRQHIRALIADSAFASYRDIAREKLADFWLTWPLQVPLSWTVGDRYGPIHSVARLPPVPVLFIHGGRDRIIPADHSRRLHRAAADPKALWIVPDGNHIDAPQRPEIRERLLEYLEMWLKISPSRPID
ncbi:MAG: alpha/beta hydrolase [Pseudomonadota bacterium]|mgnify:FL=1